MADGEVASADVELTLSLAVDPAAVGGPVDPATLQPAARSVLAVPRWNAYAFAADPTLYLPAVLRQCVQRATAVDLTRLCEGAPATVRAAAAPQAGQHRLSVIGINAPRAAACR